MLARSEVEMEKTDNGVSNGVDLQKGKGADAWKMYEMAQMHISNGEYEDATELFGQVLESLYLFIPLYLAYFL